MDTVPELQEAIRKLRERIASLELKAEERDGSRVAELERRYAKIVEPALQGLSLRIAQLEFKHRRGSPTQAPA